MTIRAIVLVIMGIVIQSAEASSANRSFYDAAIQSAKKCASGKSGQLVLSCYIKAMPSKCEDIVLDMFHDRANRLKHRRKLYSCVASCADAGFFSKHFGKCSSEL